MTAGATLTMAGAVAQVWWEGIPGLDWRHQPEDPAFANRLCAVMCATRFRALSTKSGTFEDRDTMRTVRSFEDWLSKAWSKDKGDEKWDAWDAYLRRLTLAIVCTTPTPGTSDRTMVQVAQLMYEYVHGKK